MLREFSTPSRLFGGLSLSALAHGSTWQAWAFRLCASIKITTLLLNGFIFTPPAHALDLASAQTRGDPNGVTITFSAPVSELTATNLANYEVSPSVTVTNATLIEAAKVRLHTTLIAEGQVYTLAINSVQDLAAPPNTIAANTKIAFLQTQGVITRKEFWNASAERYGGLEIRVNGIPGGTVAELTNSARFPNSPDAVAYSTNLETPVNVRDNYGVQLQGYVTAPVSGEYVFYVSSDDQGELYLSTDDTPANKRLIASEPQWNASRNWVGTERRNASTPENRSTAISLIAGRKYYLEAVMKDGGGGDNLGVAWQRPGDPTPKYGDPPISGDFLSTMKSGPVVITNQPVSQTVGEWQTVTFTADADGTPPYSFQWFKNNVEIPEATNRILTIPAVVLGDNQAVFTVKAQNSFSSATSSTAVLSVMEDTTPPRLVSVAGGLSLTNITLKFSEPMNSTDVTNLENYTVTAGLTVTGVTLGRDPATLVLNTSPQTGGTEYQVTIDGIRDVSAAGNLILPGTQASFVGWLDEEFVGPFPSWADVKRDYGAVGDGIADDSDALQGVLDVLGTPGRPFVLYLRAGTYRITKTLKLLSRVGISILGEDPATTIIKWDGAVGGVMLLADSVTVSRFGRLTWDGAGKANSAIDHSQIEGIYQINSNEHADEVFQDLAIGLRMNSPNGGDTHSILRCRFLRCSEAGISTESWNAVIQFVWYCRFEDCRIGLNCRAGSFNVYESLFLRSNEADMFVKDQFYGIRNNTSIGSKTFLSAGGADHESELTIVGNTVIDTQNAKSIEVHTHGPLLLFDNVLKSRAEVSSGPVVYVRDNLVSLGNKFTVPSPFQLDGRSAILDDQVVNRSAIPDTLPELPGTLPNRNRSIIEVRSGASASEIQQAINSANLLHGQRPVVHLPTGTYNIDQTLVIPAGCDVQLVGDGYRWATDLRWNGSGDGPVLHLKGPSRATLREFQIHVGGLQRQAKGIIIDNCDQPGARIFIDQASPQASQQHNLLVDRLDHTDVSLHDFYHWTARQSSVKVVGGPKRQAGLPVDGRVVIFGGSAGANELSYEIANGGSLLIRDSWYEGESSRFMRCTDSGIFTLDTGKIQVNDTESTRALEIDNFRGQLAFLNTYFTHRGNGFKGTHIELKGDGSETSLLLMGLMGESESYFTNTSPHAQAVLMDSVNKQLTVPITPISDAITPILKQGDALPAFLIKMLAHTRNERPRLIGPKPAAVTDARVYRVFVDEASVGIQLSGVNHAPVLEFIPDQTVVEGSPLALTNVATDADLPFNILGFSFAPGAPADATIDAVTGQFQWTPSEAQGPSTNHIGIIVTDDGVPPLSTTNFFAVVVNEVNDAPTAQATSAGTDEDTPVLITLTGTDPESDPLSFTVVSGPSHGTLSGTAPNLTYLPETNYHGTDQFTFKASDGTLESMAAQVSIIVLPGNDLPVVTLTRPAANAQFIAPATIELEAAANDVDGTIAKVEFFDASIRLGESTATPFRLKWTNVVAGSHVLTTKAMDNEGGETRSGEVTVSVLASLRSAELLTDGSLRFRLAGEPNRQYVIEISEDLNHWSQRRTNTVDAAGWMVVTEQVAAGTGARYYRARLEQ